MNWTLLILSLTGPKPAARMRLWRTLKALGAGVLRDGAYVLPESPEALRRFQELLEEVREDGGTAFCFQTVSGPQTDELVALFDRSAAYAELRGELQALVTELPALAEAAVRRRLTQLRRDLAVITAIDYFPGEPRAQAEAAAKQAALAIDAQFSPGEPAVHGERPAPVERARFLRRIWATRSRLWVDRLASAWLIRRFIDPEARFLWLAHPGDCPDDAVGFDFDGATFTHVGDLVTFEVLLASFGLDTNAALRRLGGVIHNLDVGGLPAPEAEGLAALLSGAKTVCGGDDDRLMSAASPLFDHLYAAFAAQGAAT